jgi:glycerol-3-phosphate acyltransferase PlsX
MAAPRTISLDAMGGDEGPAVVVPGAAIALDRHPDVSFLLFGDRDRIAPYLEAHPSLGSCVRVIHTDAVVEMQDKPSQAVRRGRSSSMWLALEAVHKQEADFVVSAGNTGALMGSGPRCRAPASSSTLAPMSAPPPISSPILRSWERRWHVPSCTSSGPG